MFPLKLLAGASIAATTLLSIAQAAAQPAPAPPTATAPATAPAAPAPAPAALPQAVTDAAREQDTIFLQLREAARQNDAG